ncbi:MAG: LL-diaminopimelate aminotransferase, LL-diaminopimelate aminotransferase [Candidatus Peregrinibacteria bacterium GW2011_GWE2_39_6]|nr:MAG: LL-diaminopimelate aminotransferase, LL-diaminopimelate aminotransferase [Candidatus Peregrinibacteria bacterium GW2011_GWF2_39_17]KKR25833.1 MAG: LL-diaminopimelate aminotransferase, LL-diaminopimelate aminotransferase [Candidatus Peregrinibacteria bacterium GW2011_GWE2_39_6]HCW32261.1 LL-diaminopimelate aminotransferase [Candidatus Peregrinibacteria bacterium]
MKIIPSKRLQGLSNYAFAEVNKMVNSLRDQGIQPIDFGVGDPSEPTPKFIRERLKSALEEHATTGYPFYTGSKAYLQACVNWMKRRFDVGLDPEKELCSSLGSKEAIFNFPNAILNPGDIVIIPSPGYPPMKTGTMMSGGIPFFVPLLAENKFLIDFEAIPEEVVKKTKILWLNYPNSPTGATASRDYYERLIAWAYRHDIILAADEGCYIDLYFEEKPISILEIAKEGIITFYSLSKRNNMTGYRIGFVAGDKQLIDLFKKLKTNIDSGTPNFIQEAAISALNDEQHVQSMRNIYQQKRDILFPALRDLGLEVNSPESTFYLWQKIPSQMTSVEFTTHLLSPDLALVVTPGSWISDFCEGNINPGEGYVRFALVPTLPQVAEASYRIRKYLN